MLLDLLLKGPLESSRAVGTFDYPNVFVRRALALEEIAYGRRDQQQWQLAVEDYSRAIEIWRSRPISERLGRRNGLLGGRFRWLYGVS